MARIEAVNCLIQVEDVVTELSPGVESPGPCYMEAAVQILQNVRTYLMDYGCLPNAEDVAYQLKELFSELDD